MSSNRDLIPTSENPNGIQIREVDEFLSFRNYISASDNYIQNIFKELLEKTGAKLESSSSEKYTSFRVQEGTQHDLSFRDFRMTILGDNIDIGLFNEISTNPDLANKISQQLEANKRIQEGLSLMESDDISALKTILADDWENPLAISRFLKSKNLQEYYQFFELLKITGEDISSILESKKVLKIRFAFKFPLRPTEESVTELEGLEAIHNKGLNTICGIKVVEKWKASEGTKGIRNIMCTLFDDSFTPVGKINKEEVLQTDLFKMFMDFVTILNTTSQNEGKNMPGITHGDLNRGNIGISHKGFRKISQEKIITVIDPSYYEFIEPNSTRNLRLIKREVFRLFGGILGSYTEELTQLDQPTRNQMQNLIFDYLLNLVKDNILSEADHIHIKVYITEYLLIELFHPGQEVDQMKIEPYLDNFEGLPPFF